MTRASDKNGRIPLAEWIVAGLGAVLVLATVGWLMVDLVRDTPAPPVIKLRVDSIARTQNSYVARISASNEGGETAAAARIEGALLDANADVIERSEVTLDYLPRQSQRELGLIFQHDPAQYRLQLRATGYRAP